MDKSTESENAMPYTPNTMRTTGWSHVFAQMIPKYSREQVKKAMGENTYTCYLDRV